MKLTSLHLMRVEWTTVLHLRWQQYLATTEFLRIEIDLGAVLVFTLEILLIFVLDMI